MTLLKDSVALKFGLKFKRNFEIIQKLLMVILFLEYKEDQPSQIKEIEEKVSAMNIELKKLFKLSPYIPSGKIKSTILTKQTDKMLMKMLDKKAKADFNLIHDSGKGLAASTFDAAVSDKGPFLVIIKTGQRVFGAYVHDNFGPKSGSGWISGSKETFLFTFGAEGKSPTKLLHKGSGEGIHISSCGLHLGADLVTFCSNSSSPSVYTVIAPGYPNVPVDCYLLAGASSWTPTFIEVWQVKQKGGSAAAKV